MKWRCKWCGKPHEANAPPCDNCGHGRFERTVVPVSDADGPAPVEWVCTECGRAHPRHSPPCSRCGNTRLESREPDYGDLDDLGAGGYLDLAGPRFLGVAGVAVVLGTLLVLGAVGVVDLPAVGPGGPTVAGVPGNATVAGGLSLSEVESAFVDDLNDRRTASGETALRRDETLDGVAAYLNQRYVKEAYADGERPDPGAAFERFGASCPRIPVLTVYSPHSSRILNLSVSTFDAEAELAATLATRFDVDGIPTDDARETTGVDVHAAPDGRLFVTRIVC